MPSDQYSTQEEFEQQLHLRRMNRLQEASQARYVAGQIVRNGLLAVPDVAQLLLLPPVRTFPLGEQGRLEVRQARSMRGPFSVWQNETTCSIFLWKHIVTLFLPKRTMLGDAASRAGVALSNEVSVLSPFLLSLVLAHIAVLQDLPSPEQLQLMRLLSDAAEGHPVGSSAPLSMQVVRQVVQEGFAAEQETIPLPEGLWNIARGLVLTGVMAWRLSRERAAHWGRFPVICRSSHRERRHSAYNWRCWPGWLPVQKTMSNTCLSHPPSMRFPRISG